MMLRVLLFLCCAVGVMMQPHPPINWGPGVYVFDPENPAHTQQVVDKIFSENGGQNPPSNGQFSDKHYAFLFKPGYHDVHVNVGYYTQVLGLGDSPYDTKIREITCRNGEPGTTGALNNFWRGVENVYTKPQLKWNAQDEPAMLYAVSQAAPLRRVVVDGNLDLWDGIGYSSGGYMGNSIVTGTVYSGSQQQWFSRNSQIGNWDGASWNMVFVGCNGSLPADSCPPYIVEDRTAAIAEKPFISFNSRGMGEFVLNVAGLNIEKNGPTDFNNLETTKFDFDSKVFVANEDNYMEANSHIAKGNHVIFTPGKYIMYEPLFVGHDNVIVLGIGFPTLVSASGQACVRIGEADGVRIGGLLLEPGDMYTSTLLQFGDQYGYPGKSVNPSFLYDLWARVGGPNDSRYEQVSARRMMVINNGHVIIDGTWMWRADHDVGGLVIDGRNPCEIGLEVNGDNVVAYGLAIEHTLKDLTHWNGENGKTFFYQSELPYDVTEDYGLNEYVSYRVMPAVQRHLAVGVGSYSFFRDYNVTTPSGFSCGKSKHIVFKGAFTRFLDGNGGIRHVINNVGDAVTSEDRLSYECNWNTESKFPANFTYI